ERYKLIFQQNILCVITAIDSHIWVKMHYVRGFAMFLTAHLLRLTDRFFPEINGLQAYCDAIAIIQASLDAELFLEMKFFCLFLFVRGNLKLVSFMCFDDKPLRLHCR